MQTAAKINAGSADIGFVVPTALADFPSAPKKGLLLTLEQEQSFGYRMLNHNLQMLHAIACDLDVVTNMLDEIEGSFSSTNKTDKSVTLIELDGRWVRSGHIGERAFYDLALTRIQAIRSELSSHQEAKHSVRDMFYCDSIGRLRSELCKLIPYDLILSKAFAAFRNRTQPLTSAMRAMANFISIELGLSRRVVLDLLRIGTLSAKLPGSCLATARDAHTMTPKAKKQFRDRLVEHQSEVATIALKSGVPVEEYLSCASSFQAEHLRMDRLAGTFSQVNAGLAEKIASEYRFAPDFDQVRSAAYQGLVRAMSLYAPEKGLKFSTYATNWIRQTILRELVQQDIVRLPEGSHALLTKVRAVYQDMPNASDEYVCSATGISKWELSGLTPFLKGNKGFSMDTSANAEEEGAGLHGMIADENNNFVQDVEEQSEADFIAKVLKEHLSDRDCLIMKHRLEVQGARFMTIGELAEWLETSPQNINRVEKAAQAKLAKVPELRAYWAAMQSA
jgi:RNA polymerase sigma factor (sigma-70 family)